MKTTFLQTLLAVAAMATVSSWAAAQGQYMRGIHARSANRLHADMGGGEYGGPEMYDGGYCGDCGGDCYGGCGNGCGDYGCCECATTAAAGQCGGNPCCCEQQCYSDTCCGEKLTMCYAEIQNVSPAGARAIDGRCRQAFRTVRCGRRDSSLVSSCPRVWVHAAATSTTTKRLRFSTIRAMPLDLDFEVIDVEGTGRFRTTHADFIVPVVSAGRISRSHEDDEIIQSDMPGLTVRPTGAP